jgi:ribonuclease T2
MRVLLVLLMLAGAARAEGERAGAFDYYLLSLSWSPTWCAQEGAGRDAAQCAPSAHSGWVLHGLWPERLDGGYPSWCRSSQRDPSRAQTTAMADLMGDAGAAWYQWKKHGRCSGLSAAAYLEAMRAAFRSVALPPAFERLPGEVALPAAVVEEAFLRANPRLTGAMLTVACRSGRIAEVRICLTPRLEPRDCGAGVAEDCRLERALMAPVP